VNDIRRAIVFVFAIAALWLSLARVAAADAFFTYGYSPRTIGMGNAFVATADDWTSSYYNPAGSGLQHQPTIGVGVAANYAELHPIGVSHFVLDQSNAVIFGANLPLPFDNPALNKRITFGVGAYLPEGRMLQMHVPMPSQPNLALLQNAHRTSALYPSLGLRLIDGLAVGGGAQALFNTMGVLNASLDAAGNVTTQVGQEALVRYAAVAGVMFRPGEIWDAAPPLSFGAAFRDESYTRYHIPMVAALNSIPFIMLFDAVSLYTPRQYVAGLAYKWQNWRFEADGSFNEWSRFPDPALLITVKVHIPVVPIQFENGIRRAPHYHDTFTPRAGVEGKVYAQRDCDVFVRAGYSFDPSPVPPQTGYTNQVDTDRHAGALSAGVQWLGVGATRFPTPLTFDVMWQTQYLPRRVSYKDNSVDPGNPGYPKVGVEGFLQYVGASVGIKFDYF